jgi:hypothetical protein
MGKAKENLGAECEFKKRNKKNGQKLRDRPPAPGQGCEGEKLATTSSADA